jgi:hypothetical protein
MHSQFVDHQAIELEQGHLKAKSSFAETDTSVTQSPLSASEPTQFHSHFQDCMEMYAERTKVTAYLDAHQDWFSRCAHPMKVEPIRRMATLCNWEFGAFGYEVEPKIGLELLPQDNGIYRIQTIPIPITSLQAMRLTSRHLNHLWKSRQVSIFRSKTQPSYHRPSPALSGILT